MILQDFFIFFGGSIVHEVAAPKTWTYNRCKIKPFIIITNYGPGWTSFITFSKIPQLKISLMLSNCMVIVIFIYFICYANLYSCCRYYFQRRLLQWALMPQLERLVLFNYWLNVWKMCSARQLGGCDNGLEVPIILYLNLFKKMHTVLLNS